MNSIFAQNKVNVSNSKCVLDLSKINFNENIQDICNYKTKSKSFIVNNEFINKDENELIKKDIIKGIDFQFFYQKTNKYIKYGDLFYFYNIQILVSQNEEIIAFQAFDFYEGSMKDIDNFVINLKNLLKTHTLKTGKLVNGSVVYQWHSDSKIIQLERDVKQENESNYVNGKEVVKKTCYLKLTIYNKKLISEEYKKYFKNNFNYVLYDNDHFAKH